MSVTVNNKELHVPCEWRSGPESTLPPSAIDSDSDMDMLVVSKIRRGTHSADIAH